MSKDRHDLQRAISLHQRGELSKAANIYRQMLKNDPDNVQALHYLGVVEATVGNFKQAKSLMARSLKIQPTNIKFVENYATILFQSEDYESALQICGQGLRLNNTNVSLLYVSAVALYKLKRRQNSIAHFDNLLLLQPNHIAALNERGSALAEMEKYDAALASVQKALTFAPQYAEAHLNSANLYVNLKRYDDAVTAYDTALALKPELTDAWLGRGNVFRELKRYDEALAAYDRALAFKPDLAGAWLGRGNIFSELKRYDEALAAYDKALALKPDQAWLGRGYVFSELKRYDEAFAAYDQALALKSDLAEAHFNEACLRLSLGELTEGWKKYEYRWQMKWAVGWKRELRQPLWLGDSDIGNKTILVHAEQGFGDTLLGCRYLPMVAQLGARVVAEVEPPLKSLLKNLEGISMSVVAQGEAIPYFDVYCPIMSLPLAFKTTMETIPARTPYLAVSKDLVEKWRSKLIGDEIKVGVGWAGNTNFRNDRYRSILLKNLLPALSVKGIRYFSIQKTLRQGDEQLLDANPQIRRLEQEINDFQDTAAIMMSLDLVLSSDTSIVNLAGALGRPFWVLLHDTPDWRWLDAGRETPWYPTGRLFRQKAIGDWTTVTDEVRAELEKLVASR